MTQGPHAPAGDGQLAESERWPIATRLLIPAVTEARKHVGITEDIFRTHTFHGKPREFYFWSALDEVLKTSAFLMKLDGLLGDEPLRPEDTAPEPVSRAFEAVLLEEGRLRARRLCELLTQLVLFSQKDVPELYEHMLLLDELVGAPDARKLIHLAGRKVIHPARRFLALAGVTLQDRAVVDLRS